MKTIRSYHKEHLEKTKKIKRYIFSILAVLVLISVFVFVKVFKAIANPNVKIKNADKISLFINSEDDFETVKNKLYSDSIIVNKKTFEWLAKKMEYPKYIKSGHYVITDNMNNNQLISMLRSGNQKAVKFTFNNLRKIEDLASRIEQQLEMDSLTALNGIIKSDTLKKMGFDERTVAALFIPNTYELYWNIDIEEFIERMINEYHDFWNEERKEKASSIGLSPVEVSTLASIVDKETSKVSEMPRIAGVYLNRLNKNWLLQADPTLIFALDDYTIKRVLDVHKEIESPYNTYKYVGLPPGPICLPSIAAIDAVLNAENHKYYYFCAKDDLSGYHVFSRNLREHNNHAQKYRNALNKKKIWK